MDQLLLITLVLVSGAAMAIQPGINGILGRILNQPILASAISFIIGTLSLVVIVGATGGFKAFSWQKLTGPWWLWTGGILGAFVVTVALVCAPRLGATSYLATFLVGQLATSVALEAGGLLGFPQRDIAGSRIFGLVLVALGAWLVRRPSLF